MNIDFQELMNNAKEAAKNSYSPFSRFAVGDAVITPSGKIYRGCNVENSSFGLTNCAERTAIFKAVSEGEREFVKIAISSDNSEKNEPTWPCGICRQVIVEFAENIKIITGSSTGDILETSIQDLLPHYFSKSDL